MASLNLAISPFCLLATVFLAATSVVQVSVIMVEATGRIFVVVIRLWLERHEMGRAWMGRGVASIAWRGDVIDGEGHARVSYNGTAS